MVKRIPPGELNFKDSDCPDMLNKSGTALCQMERKLLVGIMNDHGLEHFVSFPTPEINSSGLILTSSPSQF